MEDANWIVGLVCSGEGALGGCAPMEVLRLEALTDRRRKEAFVLEVKVVRVDTGQGDLGILGCRPLIRRCCWYKRDQAFNADQRWDKMPDSSQTKNVDNPNKAEIEYSSDQMAFWKPF